MLRLELLQGVAHELLGLAPGGAVPDRHRLGVVLRHDHRHRLRGLERILQREDDGLAQVLAGRPEHRHLAAGADAGVDGEHRLLAERRGEEQVAQVLGEHLDRGAIRLGLLLDRYVDLAARGEEALEGVACGGLHLVARGAGPGTGG